MKIVITFKTFPAQKKLMKQFSTKTTKNHENENS